MSNIEELKNYCKSLLEGRQITTSQHKILEDYINLIDKEILSIKLGVEIEEMFEELITEENEY